MAASVGVEEQASHRTAPGTPSGGEEEEEGVHFSPTGSPFALPKPKRQKVVLRAVRGLLHFSVLETSTGVRIEFVIYIFLV